MTFAALSVNLARVREEIARIQAAARISGTVRIVGITKGHPRAAAEAAAEAGLEDVGENRIQEAVAKQDGGPPVPVRWHMVGHLQTNKAKYVPGRFWMVHSVDSIRIAEALAEALDKVGERMRVLVQVSLAAEPQKSGCPPGEVASLVHRVGGLQALDPVGLMTMAPLTEDEPVQREVFGDLRRLRDEVATPELPLPELSMGMSGDYRAAVAEGATIVRLGTVLFGERR